MRSADVWKILAVGLRVAATVAETECGLLTCQHGATCEDGPPNFDDHQLEDGSFLYIHQQQPEGADYHCECPARYTGAQCDIPYQKCGDKHKCYFGGECLTGLEDVLEPDELFCDCSMAEDSEGGRHVGKYCEHLLSGELDTWPASFQSVLDPSVPVREDGKYKCHIDGRTEDYSCLFDSKCNPDYPLVSKQPCLCADGFTGPYCEYREGDVPDCNLSCQNGSVCRMGRPDPVTNKMAYDLYRQTNVDIQFMWCDCTDGFYGDLCEISSIPCGNGFCFNNGQCIDQEDSTGARTHSCSCQNSDGSSFSGKFCEYEATTYCPHDGNVEGDNFFCANGGTCRDEAWLGCDCPPGYGGFSCGYFVGFDSAEASTQEIPACDLDCNGQGTCVTGLKNLEYLGTAAYAQHLNISSNEDFQHCVCRDGYTGLQCDHEVEHCSDEGDHFCLHGSQCVKVQNGKTFCDCTTATSAFADAFAGIHCEHPATSICADTSSFCVNGGTCPNTTAKSEETHAACLCPNGWKGTHCEIKVTYQSIDDGLKAAARGTLLFGVTLLSVALFACAYYRLRHRIGCKYRGLDSTRSLDSLNKWPVNRAAPSPSTAINLSPYKDVAPKSTEDFFTIDSQSANALIFGSSQTKREEPNDPILYMGPPCDEDGNALHDITIC
ncbi:hypothetical protein ACA910_012830 [Epithemia clementina (nom. ined.)]